MDQGTRFLLKRVSDQLQESDIQNLKYLCKEIPAGELENLRTGYALFECLQQKCIISKNNLSRLEQLLKTINRQDLARLIQMSGTDENLETESALKKSPSMTMSDKMFKSFLHRISEELTKDNVDSLLFLIDLPAAVKERIRNGKDLFTELCLRQEISAHDVSPLVDMFESIYRMDLAGQVKKYQQEKGLLPNVPQPQQRNNTREPTGHSEIGAVRRTTLQSDKATLMKPEDFIPKKPAKVDPLQSRYPVQVVREARAQHVDQIDQMPSYPMNRNPRGIALIISNKYFEESPDELRERRGTESDTKNLERLWKNLHFVVKTRNNLKAHEIYDVVRDFSMMDHSSYDCFVCCLLSHGKNGEIYGSDSQLLALHQITSQLTGVSCPTLAGKPKLFFIQACRGRDFDHGATPQQDAVEGTPEERMRHSAEPNESHFLLGYATPPGYVSWRSQIHGSWYISKICDVFQRYCQTEDLMSMMVKVNQEVSEAFTRQGYRQCPAPVVTLTKKIYLKKLD